ncbi:MAG: amino acid ABC transporter permease [Tropicimonas sp.]|uniref:amino acid ABC transporter permease n=1 Tax=Tropicimonas sp. TaxID=2067044 RepID=UPI003A88EC41
MDSFATYLASIYNFRIVAQYADEFARGIANALLAAGASLVLSLVFGFLLALMRLSGRRVMTVPAAIYLQSIRATPLLLQIYIVYFGLPLLIPASARWPELVLGIVALSVHTTPYMSEIIRAGILAVPRGQREAAIAVGMTPAQQYRHVILPLAVARMVAPLLGQVAILVKDTSLLSLITVFDIVSAGMLLNSERILPNEGFMTVAAIYLLIYVVLLGLSRLVERRLGGSALARGMA